MFIDREAELGQLENLYRSGRAELFVLYGRRRVGKTELLQAFCGDKPHLFFVATLSSDADQLAAFSQAIWRYTHDQAPEGFTFPSWEAALGALADLPGRPVVALDEFTYLMGGNKAVPSILQKVWDETLRHTQVLLILCGSYIGMMEREVLGYGAPLYGRRTGSALLAPLPLPAAALFFPGYTPVQQLEIWAVLGGMPYYLAAFDDTVDLWDNLHAQILDQRGLLYNEPQLLFMEELREPRNYFSVLRAIAQGHTRLSRISQAAGLGSSTTTARYLDILQSMQLVRRQVPVTEAQPEKSKRGLYQIVDPFLRFWFRYVHPNRGALDLGLSAAILEQRVRPSFDSFVGQAFEEAARAEVARLARQGSLSFLPERVGSWWDRQTEIDVVAVSDAEGALLVGECKWWSGAVGVNVLEALKGKVARLNADGRYGRVEYLLCAKAGFTPELRAMAEREGVRLVTAAELVG